jgi:endonuclease III
MSALHASVGLKAMSPLKSPSKRAALIFERFAATGPVPTTELYFRSPFQLLVSVVLSAQTTDKSVNRCMRPLYDAGLTPEVIVALGEPGFLAHIKSIGLAPTKARHVVRLSQILISDYQGQVPSNRDALESLPGVGRKTANVVLAELFNAPTLGVDTHVFRVTRRLGLHNEADARRAEAVLLDVIDKKYLPAAHHWLIMHGRYVCQARRPLCERCLIADLCPKVGIAKSPKSQRPQPATPSAAKRKAHGPRGLVRPSKPAARKAAKISASGSPTIA